MLRYWRVLLLVIMVIASILAIGMKTFPQGRIGVEVIYVADGSPFQDQIIQGMVITDVNGNAISTVQDWNQYLNSTGNVTIRAGGERFTAQVEDGFGVNVIGIERTNLDFGLDLKGGTRVILKPVGNLTDDVIEQTLGILETRANLFGLREIKFFAVRDLSGNVFIQLEAAGVGNDIVDDLLSRQGQFEAKIQKPVQLVNDSGNLQLGFDVFPITANGDIITLDGETHIPGDVFVFEDMEFEYINRTDNRIDFLVTLFDGEDIELVYTDPQRSGVTPQGGGYQFFFQVLISIDGASRFADVTTGISRSFDVSSGQEYLDSSLQLFLDGELMSSLRIQSSLAGQVIQSPQITGGAATLEEAIQERLRLQTILQSGALPVSFTVESVDVVSPTLGAGFFEAAGFAVLLAGIVVFVVVYIRYRKLKIALPLVVVGISEALIILGIAATNDVGIWAVVLLVNFALIIAAWIKKYEIDVYAWIGAALIPLIGMMSWTIDLPALAGIIAVIGTGVDHQIIIADEALKGRRKLVGISDQLKKASFIIVGAAATTIFAMLPLLFVGIGFIRGFAITTIAGVLVGILITRPAYARIVERMLK